MRWLLSLALVPLAITACAPDAWRSDSSYDAFLDQVRIKCSATIIGLVSISDLMPDATTTDAYFMDVTSRYYHRQISLASYLEALEGSYTARPDSTGIACLLRQMPGKTASPPALEAGGGK